MHINSCRCPLVTMDCNLHTMVSLREQRMKACKKHKCQKYNDHLCGPCRRLCQRLCRGYHKTLKNCCSIHEERVFAADELLARLVYEFVFGFVDLCTITMGTWMDCGIRDDGHTIRMQKLFRIAWPLRFDPGYEWLNVKK